jgi:hypothetical protein
VICLVETELYARQNLIAEVSPPESAIVVGVGGIGSYVAIQLAMVGVKRILLIDPDIVEESNRNRVLFRTKDVGVCKTEAIRDIIMSLRTDCEVNCINLTTEKVIPLKSMIDPKAILIDCRDNIEPLPSVLPKPLMKLGYDGLSCTIHINPDYENIMGAGDGRYTTTPSYCVPACLMGTLATMYATIPSLRTDQERCTTFNLPKMFGGLFNG